MLAEVEVLLEVAAVGALTSALGSLIQMVMVMAHHSDPVSAAPGFGPFHQRAQALLAVAVEVPRVHAATTGVELHGVRVV